MPRTMFKRAGFTFVVAIIAAIWVAPQETTKVGYAVLSLDSGAATATALFSYSNSEGILVSQAGVAPSKPVSRGRIFVAEGETRTGLALVNVSRNTASVSLTLRDVLGVEIARTVETLGAGEHLPRFVGQLFPNLPAGFTGSLSFESEETLSAITLRESRNAQGEPIYTTLPVVDLDEPPDGESVVFPQVAVGDGYITEIILINPHSRAITGRLNLYGSHGEPFLVESETAQLSELQYDIRPHGIYRAAFGRSGGVASGYAVIRPDAGSGMPSGVAVFRFQRNEALITEAGVGASSPTVRGRIYVDYAAGYTGVALANPNDTPARVTYSLLDNNGALIASAEADIPPRGHVARFAHDLFPTMPRGFTGMVDISSGASLCAVTLKLTINPRADLVYTTLPVADLTRPPSERVIVFPQVAFGAGFSTRLIYLNALIETTAVGSLSFYQSTGSALTVTLGENAHNQFLYYLPAGGAKQLQPDNAARIASITLWDPATQGAAAELAVNEGSSMRPSLLVLDTEGMPRDDFLLKYATLAPEIATVDSYGTVSGVQRGFSTLIVSTSTIVTKVTVTVAAVGIGVAGFKVTGIAQDLAKRLYLAATPEHMLLTSENATSAPQIYAGQRSHPGLRNDVRLQSWFNTPAFLGFDQARGTLYVSDSANNVIRLVQPGPQGRVETLAGTGHPGAGDGRTSEAEFNNPQGVALDGRGHLWVVDSGNHTVRRVDLASGVVQTVAGSAGSSGWNDGLGPEARFQSPTGIAIEHDGRFDPSFLSSGGTPHPVTVIVADTGNGVLRRIDESGRVETVGETPESQSIRHRMQTPAPPTVRQQRRFDSPAGVAVDFAGNIYVTEPTMGTVRVVLRNGDVVLAAQGNTFRRPTGIAALQKGRFFVADSDSSAREISYGEPQILATSPAKVSNKGGHRVTVAGRNFAPDSLVVVGGELPADFQVLDTQTISFTAPPLPSGQTTLTIQNRGGVAQSSLMVDAVPVAELPIGFVTTIAGGTTYAGDGWQATAAGLAYPSGVAIDSSGNLFIADFLHHRIRRVSARTGLITTVAGSDQPGYAGDGGPATAARLNLPNAVVLDRQGNLYISDSGNYRIRRVDGETGKISTVAGGGDPPNPPGDGLSATDASLGELGAMALDDQGNLYIADAGNHRLRRVDAQTGVISTVAGAGNAGYAGDGGPAEGALLNAPRGVALDSENNIFVADSGNYRVRRIDSRTGLITTVAGNGERGYSGDGMPATAASLGPYDLALDTAGNIFIADRENNRARKVEASSQIITTIAGGGAPPDFLGDQGPATGAVLNFVQGIAVDAAGNIFLADTGHHRVRLVDAPGGTIRTFAGSDKTRFAGDGGPATAATLNVPLASAVDPQGNVFISDSDNNRIRRVNAQTGIITTFAGNGKTGYSGDGSAASAAEFVRPAGMAFDRDGNLYFAASGNHNIRRVDSQTGLISTVAGTGEPGYSGDGGPAREAALNAPQGVAFDPGGTLFIVDSLNDRIRRVNPDQTIVTWPAGPLREPSAIAFDRAGNMYIADSGNHRIRKIDTRTQQIETVAGNGTEGYEDDVPATGATLAFPVGLVLDDSGNIFVADGNNRVRRVDAATGIITTVVGAGDASALGDNGPARSVQLGFPFGVSLDTQGNLYVTDTYNQRIRVVRGPLP